jgi:hypothetical protein
VLGGVDIYFQTRPEVDPYFLILMLDPLVLWWRAWFLLRDDADAPLPSFTGSCPILHSSWGYSVAQMDLRWLQPLLEAIQGLLQWGLMALEILQTFFSCGVQPLHRQEVNEWMHLGPICPDCPFSAKLDNTGINTWI